MPAGIISAKTVAKARRFAETQKAVKTKKFVQMTENRKVDHNVTATTKESVLKPLYEGFKEIVQTFIHVKAQVASVASVACITKEGGFPHQDRASLLASSRGSNQSA